MKRPQSATALLSGHSLTTVIRPASAQGTSALAPITPLAQQALLTPAPLPTTAPQVQITPQERCITAALAHAQALADLLPRHQRRQDKLDQHTQPSSGRTSADVDSDSDSDNDADLDAPARAAAARTALDSALSRMPQLRGMAPIDPTVRHCQAYCLALQQAHTCQTVGHHLPETCNALYAPNPQNIQLARLEVLSLLSLTAQPDPQLLQLLTRLLQMASGVPMTLAATALLPGSLGKHMALTLQAAYLQGSDLPLPSFELQGTLPPYIKGVYLPLSPPEATASQAMFRLSDPRPGVWEAALSKATDVSEQLCQCLALQRTQRTHHTRQLRQNVQQRQIAQHRQSAQKALQQMELLDQWQTPIDAPLASTPTTDPRVAHANAVLLVDQHQQSLTQPQLILKALAQHPPQAEALQSACESVLLDCLRQNNPPAHLALLDCLLRIDTNGWFSVKQTAITQALNIPAPGEPVQSNALERAIDTLVRATGQSASPIAHIALCGAEVNSRSQAYHAPNLDLLFSHPGIRSLRLDGVILFPKTRSPHLLVPMARSALALERLELVNLDPAYYAYRAIANLIQELPVLRELSLGVDELPPFHSSLYRPFADAVVGKKLDRLEIAGSTMGRSAPSLLLQVFEEALKDSGSKHGAMQQPTLGTVATTIRFRGTDELDRLFGYLGTLVKAGCSGIELRLGDENAADLEKFKTYVSEGHSAVTDWLTAMEQRTSPLHLTLHEGHHATQVWLASLPSNRLTCEQYALDCIEKLSVNYEMADVNPESQDMNVSLNSLAQVIPRLKRLRTVEVVMEIPERMTHTPIPGDPDHLARALMQTGNKTDVVIPQINRWSIQFQRSLDWSRFGAGSLQIASWGALLKQASGHTWPTEIVQRILDELNTTGHALADAPSLNRAQLINSVEQYGAMQAYQSAQGLPVPAWVARHPRHDLAQEVQQRLTA